MRVAPSCLAHSAIWTDQGLQTKIRKSLKSSKGSAEYPRGIKVGALDFPRGISQR